MMDLIAALGVMVVLTTSIIITSLNAHKLKGETSRKIIHITMGLTALTFPFIFTNSVSVVALGVVAVSSLFLLRRLPFLRNSLGKALLSIERKSYGEIWFAVSIAVVFIFHESLYEYFIPILILTFADSVAAFIGANYGRKNLASLEEDPKSKEGSFLFFIVAFICTLVPLQLMTEIGRAEVLLISFLVGMLGAMIEAVSVDGNDNVLLPLLTYSFIRYNSYAALSLLFANFFVILLFWLLILIIRKTRNLSRLSMAYSLLVGYVLWIQGGFAWVIFPLILLLTYGILPKMGKKEKAMLINYKVIEGNTIIGVVLCCVAVFFPQYIDILYIAFSFSFACYLTINTYSRLVNFENATIGVAALAGICKAVAFIALPALFITQMHMLIFGLYVALLAFATLPTIHINKVLDFKNINSTTARVNLALVAMLTVIIILLGGFIKWFI